MLVCQRADRQPLDPMIPTDRRELLHLRPHPPAHPSSPAIRTIQIAGNHRQVEPIHIVITGAACREDGAKSDRHSSTPTTTQREPIQAVPLGPTQADTARQPVVRGLHQRGQSRTCAAELLPGQSRSVRPDLGVQDLLEMPVGTPLTRRRGFGTAPSLAYISLADLDVGITRRRNWTHCRTADRSSRRRSPRCCRPKPSDLAAGAPLGMKAFGSQEASTMRCSIVVFIHSGGSPSQSSIRAFSAGLIDDGDPVDARLRMRRPDLRE